MEPLCYDFLSYAEDPKILKIIGDEKLLFSGDVTKINVQGVIQERTLIITNKGIYNMKKTSFKRRVELKNVRGITISSLTDEIVIHCIDIENDFDFVSEKRNEIIKTLLKAYKEVTLTPLMICQVSDKTLKAWVTEKNEKKKDKDYTRMNIIFAIDSIEYFKQIEEGMKALNINDNSKTNEEDTTHEKKKRSNTLYSNHKTVKTVCLDDFKILKVLGKGAFAKVTLVEHKLTKEVYAMKILKKDLLLDQNQVEATLLEKKILQTLNHPFLVGMVFCFQTEERIYFLMPFVRGGELFQHLKNFKKLNEETVRFYAGIIGMGLGHIHSNGIIYRDLKPENILIDEEGYLKITDFGLAKILPHDEKATSFCGTPEYLAPEIITGEGHNAAADWWSYGILIYEMLYGIPPFYNENQNIMYDKITQDKLRFIKISGVSDSAKDLLKKLLNKKPEERLGSKGDFEEIKTHPFFTGLDFNLLFQKKLPAPFKPSFSGKYDVQHFDEEFTSEDTVSSVIPERKLEYIKLNQDLFEDFNK